MNTHSKTENIWDDLDCTVSDEYNQSVGINGVYQSNISRNILVEDKGSDRSARYLGESQEHQDLDAIQMPNKAKIMEKLNMSEDTPRASVNMLLSSQDEDQDLWKDVKHQKKSTFFLPMSQKLKSTSKATNWKEKCRNNQLVASPKMLMSLRSKSAHKASY
ncbi:unnamed protein product [Moneuplotes crassus]|uniref:Uncharacterized protein n=1 Tax=Euplotes crassus TaxID=5936 RepID=A0AAD1U614_EUPCR|nr:unnamed protein product [Moneuplotes crassus]